MENIGFLLAFVSAIGFTAQTLGIKIATKDTTPLVTLIVSMVSTVLIITPYVIYTGIPQLEEFFLPLLILNTFLIGGGILFKFKSLSVSEASLVTPISSFVPLFLLVFSPFILGEEFTVMDIIGVLLIISGSYVLQASDRKILEPIKKLFSNRGVVYMILFAILVSLGSTLDKIGISKSSTVFWLFCLYSSIAVLMLTIQSQRENSIVKDFRKTPKILVLTGIANAIMITTQLAAYNYTLVTFTLSIKRLGILGVVVGSFFLFNESNVKKRFIASIPMIIGAGIITIL